MGISIVVTLILVVAAAAVIAFYPVSRGLWAVLLYVTGARQEPD